jgi:ABC-2 type transport system ATP-binding protein
MGAAIRCEGLSRSFGEVRALEALDLAVPAGCIYGFLGRNGAGKTTTLRLLSGLARASAGKAFVSDVEVKPGGVASQRLLGFLPEEPAFYGWLTPREHLEYAASIFALAPSGLAGRIDEVLRTVGLEKERDRRVAGFSRGMRQRLGLGLALVHQPSVLLLDEPTSALDPAGRHEVIELIERLRGTVTIFLSTHILSDVERVCDRIGILRQGRLLLDAPKAEVLAQHAPTGALVEVETVDAMAALKAALEAASWVRSVTIEGGTTLRLAVTDAPQGREELLALLVAQRAPVVRVEWRRPSLEDVFLALSA